MNLSEKKQYILYAFLILLTITPAVFLASGLIPGVVSYTISTPEQSITAGETPDTHIESAIYKSIYSIQEDGPFEILPEGEDIFVFSGEKRLYRIKASLSDFPEKDKSVISSGISIKDTTGLYEIIQYMES